MKYKWILLTLIIALAIAFGLALPSLSGGVKAQFTIPTRTPVPGSGGNPTSAPPQPTNDNGGGGGGGGGQQPQATNTPQPATNTPVPPASGATNTPLPSAGGATAIASATPLSTAVATETALPTATSTATEVATVTTEPITEQGAGAIGNGQPTLAAPVPIEFENSIAIFAEADECGEPPTITLLAATDSLAGPGNDYLVVVSLASEDVRPIIGRSAYDSWWLVQLNAEGDSAWLPDASGTVHGFTGNVRVVAAPSINGAVATPGSIPWEPTPAPNCVTEMVDGSVAVIGAADARGSTSSTGGDVGAASASVAEEIVAESTAAPIQLPSQASAAPNFMPIIGLVLVAAAIFLALVLRRGQRTQT